MDEGTLRLFVRVPADVLPALKPVYTLTMHTAPIPLDATVGYWEQIIFEGVHPRLTADTDLVAAAYFHQCVSKWLPRTGLAWRGGRSILRAAAPTGRSATGRTITVTQRVPRAVGPRLTFA